MVARVTVPRDQSASSAPGNARAFRLCEANGTDAPVRRNVQPARDDPERSVIVMAPPFPPPGLGRRGGSRPPFRRRSRPRNVAPESVADLLPSLVARLGGQDRATEQRVAQVWDEAVGPMLAKHSRPEGVRGKTLLVRVSNSSYAHELVLLRREILERLTRSLGVTLVEEIRSRVGPLF